MHVNIPFKKRDRRIGLRGLFFLIFSEALPSSDGGFYFAYLSSMTRIHARSLSTSAATG